MCHCRFIVGRGALSSNIEHDFDGKLTLIYGNSTPAGQGTILNTGNCSSIKGFEAVNDTFTTRHTCDMRFTYISEK